MAQAPRLVANFFDEHDRETHPPLAHPQASSPGLRGHAHTDRARRLIGYSRPTVYRWLRRFDRYRLDTLEDASSRPRRRRRPTWTLRELASLRRLRLAYPRWGKVKLAVLLRREALCLSVSMVGRILARLRATGELRDAPRRAISARHRVWQRPRAVRKPAGFVVARPGDLVQLETLDVRPLPGMVFKQFTARDAVSRWDVLGVYSSGSARSAPASSWSCSRPPVPRAGSSSSPCPGAARSSMAG